MLGDQAPRRHDVIVQPQDQLSAGGVPTSISGSRRSRPVSAADLDPDRALGPKVVLGIDRGVGVERDYHLHIPESRLLSLESPEHVRQRLRSSQSRDHDAEARLISPAHHSRSVNGGASASTPVTSPTT